MLYKLEHCCCSISIQLSALKSYAFKCRLSKSCLNTSEDFHSTGMVDNSLALIINRLLNALLTVDICISCLRHNHIYRYWFLLAVFTGILSGCQQQWMLLEYRKSTTRLRSSTHLASFASIDNILGWVFKLTWAEGSFWSKFVLRCCRRRCHKLFTFSSSSPEPQGQFQPNFAQSILGYMGFNFFSNVAPPPFSKERP